MSEIHEAIVAALADLTGVAKGRKGGGGGKVYNYANIEDVVELTRPALAAHDLVAMQPMCPTEVGLGIRTVLVHKSGETFDAGTVAFRPTGDPQRDGGLITYYRRYSLLSALGMAAEDDDGAAASRPAPPKPGMSVKDAKSALLAKLEAEPIGDARPAAAEVWKRADLSIEDNNGTPWVTPAEQKVLDEVLTEWLNEPVEEAS